MNRQVWSELMRSSCNATSDTCFLCLFTVMLHFIPHQQHFQSSLWFLLRTGHFNCAKLCQMWELWDLKWCKLRTMKFPKSTSSFLFCIWKLDCVLSCNIFNSQFTIFKYSRVTNWASSSGYLKKSTQSWCD